MRTVFRAASVVAITLGLVYLVGQAWGKVAIPVPTASVVVLEALRMERVTYYNPVAAQTDSDPLTSACGPNLERQVAVSRDLFRSTLDCGDRVRVWADGEYHGEFTVWDTMHTRWRSTLDIMTDTEYAWGKTVGHVVLVH